MTIQCKECLTECPDNAQKCFRCNADLEYLRPDEEEEIQKELRMEDYDKAAHDAAWEKHFVIPIAIEMKNRGIRCMCLTIKDDGKLTYVLDTELPGENACLSHGDGSATPPPQKS